MLKSNVESKFSRLPLVNNKNIIEFFKFILLLRLDIKMDCNSKLSIVIQIRDININFP